MLHSLKPVLALALAAAALPAAASIVTVNVDRSFAAAPITYSLGASSITFTLLDRSAFASDPAGVSTGGTTQVLSLGAPFYNPPQPTSFFSDRGGSIGPSTLGQFVSYATPTTIPYSATDSIVGFRFNLGSGFQYGYAEIAGSTLYGFRYQTTPGVGVDISAVPEPASWALMIAGFGLVGTAARRRRVDAVTA